MPGNSEDLNQAEEGLSPEQISLLTDTLSRTECKMPSVENLSIIHDLALVMMAIEYQRECDFLKSLLLEPGTFKQGFKEACIRRQKDKEHSINFSLFANTPTNDLYKELAQIVFQEDAVSVLLPGINKTYVIENPSDRLIYDPKKTPWREQLKHFTPTLVEQAQKPRLDGLNYYVLGEDYFFDVRNLLELMVMDLQFNFYQHLNSQHSELAKQIYSHNEALQALEYKISLHNKQRAPIDVIKQVIRAFKWGGSHITGHEEQASIEAQRTYQYFIEFLAELPAETRAELDILTGSVKTFKMVLADLKINENSCVESAANNLQAIIDRNANAEALHAISENKRPQATLDKEFAANLNKMKLEKDKVTLISSLPAGLILAALAKLRFDDPGLKITLIRNIPQNYFEAVWAFFADDTSLHQQIVTAIHDRFLDNQPELRAILLDKVCTKRFSNKSPEIIVDDYWCKNFPAVFQFILAKHEKEILSKTKLQDDILTTMCRHSEHLECFFKFLGKEKALALTINNDNMVRLILSDIYLEVFMTAFAFDDEVREQLLSAPIDYKNRQDNLRTRSLRNSTLFTRVLMSFPENKRWAHMSKHFAAIKEFMRDYESDISSLLHCLPEADRANAIQQILAEEPEALFTKATKSSRLFKLILPHLTPEQCTTIVSKTVVISSYEFYLWEDIIKDEELLKNWLAKYKPEEYYSLLLTLKKDSMSFAHELAKNKPWFFTIYNHLTPDEKISILGQTIAKTTSYYREDGSYETSTQKVALIGMLGLDEQLLTEMLTFPQTELLPLLAERRENSLQCIFEDIIESEHLRTIFLNKFSTDECAQLLFTKVQDKPLLDYLSLNIFLHGNAKIFLQLYSWLGSKEEPWLKFEDKWLNRELAADLDKYAEEIEDIITREYQKTYGVDNIPKELTDSFALIAQEHPHHRVKLLANLHQLLQDVAKINKESNDIKPKVDIAFRAYVRRFNAIPEVSPTVKRLCIALATTIVGLVPAAIIWSAQKINLFFKREDLHRKVTKLVTALENNTSALP